MYYTISLLFEHLVILHTGLTFSIQSHTYTLTTARISHQVKEKHFVAIHKLLTFLRDHSIFGIGRTHLGWVFVSLRTKLLCILCTVVGFSRVEVSPIPADPKAVLFCV